METVRKQILKCMIFVNVFMLFRYGQQHVVEWGLIPSTERFSMSLVMDVFFLLLLAGFRCKMNAFCMGFSIARNRKLFLVVMSIIVFPIAASHFGNRQVLSSDIFFLLDAGFVSPALEEIIYRGIVYQILRKCMAGWAALLLDSVLFSLGHSGIHELSCAFLFSCMAILLFESTKSIWSPIFFHSGCNLMEIFTPWEYISKIF